MGIILHAIRPERTATYEQELLGQWRGRATWICIIGFASTFTIWAIDYTVALFGLEEVAVTSGWELGKIRLSAMLAPAIGAVVLATMRDNHKLAAITIFITLLFVFLNDVAFYRAGYPFGTVHSLVRVLEILVIVSLLPMTTRQRLFFFFGAWMALLAADLGWGTGFFSTHSRIWIHATQFTFLGILAAPVEYFYSMRRDEFDLRQDLSATVDELAASRDEIGRAAQQLAISVEHITGATGQLASSADHAQRDTVQIATTVEQVAASADALATRSQESASEAEENRSRTARVRERIEQIRVELDRLNTSIGGAGTRFDQLQAQSQQVGQFVDTIREIAAQTNLLALNAGIEASRAGEQGRGFGVVADEVRKLAEQAHESSEQVSESVAAVQDEVAGTLRIVREVVAASEGFAALFEEAKFDLSEIAAAADRFNDRNKANAVDAREQAQATGEISHGTSQVLHQVREFTQMSEEVTATARDLQTLAEELQRALAKD